MAQPYRHPTTGVFYIRRKVPGALKAALGHEYKRSLKTREPAEAKARFAGAWADAERVFARARAQAGGGTLLSKADAEQLSSRWLRDEQERLDRSGGFLDVLAVGAVQIDAHGDEHPIYTTFRDFVDGDEAVWLDHVLPRVKDALRAYGLPMPAKDSASYRWVMEAIGHELQRLSDWALARYEGDASARDIKPQPTKALKFEEAVSSLQSARKLRDLFKLYREDKVLNDGNGRGPARTIKAYEAIVERFIELHGDKDVAAIDRELMGAHRKALGSLPAKGEGIRGLSVPQLIEKAKAEGWPLLTEGTINNGLRAISAILSHGVRLGWLAENPAIASGVLKSAKRAVTRKLATARKRNEYTSDELTAIFSSPVFTQDGWEPPRAKFGKAWYWLPLLMYYTGARREELAQLKVSEVAKSADGIWYLDILSGGDEGDGGRSVKTEGSRRLVPLHPDLIDRGLIGYLDALPKTGQLFPLLMPNPAGFYGANFGKRWADYLKAVVRLNTTVSPSHGFRHTFKTRCRESGIPEDVHDAITGHAGGNSVARRYGSMPLKRMSQALRRLPGLIA